MKQRKRVHNLDLKTQISQAATKLFFTYGYDKTTLRMIGEAVGIAHASIMGHFENKSAIAAVTIRTYLDSLELKCSELFDALPKSYHKEEDYTRLLIWWTLHFKLLSDNDAFRDFYIAFYRDGAIALSQLMKLAGKTNLEKMHVVLEEADVFIARSLVTAADATLASLIDLSIIDYIIAAKQIFRQSGAAGLTQAYSPTELEISSFAEKYIADIKIDVLNDFLLKNQN